MSVIKVLIADHGKASLVMTSEIVKDRFPGAIVFVADTGKEALEILKTKGPDLCIIDFDLHDADGATLIRLMRPHFQGPLLLTAYPDPMVEQAVANEFFGYDDASGWISKPVKMEILAEKIDAYVNKRRRIESRFQSRADAIVVGKALGRGKKAPKIDGTMSNISINGACIEIDGKIVARRGDEVNVTLMPPKPSKKVGKTPAKASPKGKLATPTTAKAKAAPAKEVKVRMTVAWINKEKNRLGLRFHKVTEVQREGIESFLKAAADVDKPKESQTEKR